MAKNQKLLLILATLGGAFAVVWAILDYSVAWIVPFAILDSSLAWIVPTVATSVQVTILTSYKIVNTTESRFKRIGSLSEGQKLAIFLGIIISLIILAIFGTWAFIQWLISIGVPVPSYVGWVIFFGVFLIIGLIQLIKSPSTNNYFSVVFSAGFIFYFVFSDILGILVPSTFFYILWLAISIVAYIWLVIFIGFIVFRTPSLKGKKYIEESPSQKKRHKFEAKV